MPKFLIIIPISLSMLTLSACTGKPREVSASIPLVSSSQTKPNKQEVPQQYWSQLSDPVQTQVEHDKYKIKLFDLYTSALGQTCRELQILDKTIESNDVERRTVCETTYKTNNKEVIKSWFLEKKIIESSIYVEL